MLASRAIVSARSSLAKRITHSSIVEHAKPTIRRISTKSSKSAKRRSISHIHSTQRASYSTESAKTAEPPAKVSLKIALRKFYMIVHPDRLTGHPKEQKTNDDSFRSLNSYLDTFRNEKASDDDLAHEYKVKFYVPKQGGETGFTIATSTLILPPRGSSPQARERLIHDSIVSLFHQCGLDIDVDVSGYGAPAGSQAATSGSAAVNAQADPPPFKALANLTAHLGAFSRKTTPAGKKLHQIYQSHQQAVDAAMKRLATKHKATVHADLPPVLYKSSIERNSALATHLKKLEAALDRVGVPIHQKFGQAAPQIVLSHKKKGWAHTGHFYVDVEQEIDDIVSHIHESADPSLLKALQEYSKQRVAKESDLKSALDLASVTSEHGVGVSESYMNLLDAIAVDIASNSHKWLLPEVARKRVHLRFTNGVSADHIPVDGSTASLLIPVDTTPANVRSFLAENAAEAAKRFQRLETALKSLKTLLNVKSVSYQPGMDVDHLKQGIERLAQAADQIRPFLGNVNLLIGKQYAVNEENQQLMIKWNFYL